MAIIAVITMIASFFGRITLLVEQKKDRSVVEVINGKLSFIMSFERHDKFWIKSYFGKLFHVLSVGEGLLLIALLSLGMYAAVRWMRPVQKD